MKRIVAVSIACLLAVVLVSGSALVCAAAGESTEAEALIGKRLQTIQSPADEGDMDEGDINENDIDEGDISEGDMDEGETVGDLKETKQLHEQVKEMVRLALTDKEQAMEQIQTFLVEHPGNKEALKAAAKIQEEQGKFKDAVESLETAAALEFRNQENYRNMERLYAAMGDKSLKVYVNGKKPAFEVPPVVKSGRTLVPVRAIVEALGAAVEWKEQTREVVISKGDIAITLQLENKVALVNGQTVELDAPPKSENGRTVIPLRFISEQLKCGVTYDEGSGVITVTEPETNP